MIRALFRLLSLICTAAAMVAAVLDTTRSIANSQIVFTPLYDDWVRLNPASLESTRDFLSESVHPTAWDPVMLAVLKLPTWAVFAALAVLFAVATAKRRKRWQESFGD